MNKFPARVINVGIAEQNLIGFAAGVANGGFIPFTGNAAPFLINRSLDQLRVDLSYSNSNVKVIGLHTGFSYGTDGITHHEVNDVGILRTLPNIDIYVPCDGNETEHLTEFIAANRRPVYISLNSGAFPDITNKLHLHFEGKPLQFSEGDDLTIIALGTAVHDALEAAGSLGSFCSPEIFALTSVRPLDPAPLLASIKKTGRVLTVEQHSINSGAGSIAAALIAENGLGAKLKRLGIPEGSFTRNASAPENKRYFGLDSTGIEKTVKELLSMKT